MSKTFNLWLLTFILQLSLVLTSAYFGSFNYFYSYDETYLSFIALITWVILSFSIGLSTYKNIEINEWQRDSTDIFMYMGLLGTAIGMSLVFSAFFSVDTQTPEAVKTLITTVGTGMASALGPTMCGILSSVFSKIQISIVDHYRQEIKIL